MSGVTSVTHLSAGHSLCLGELADHGLELGPLRHIALHEQHALLFGNRVHQRLRVVSSASVVNQQKQVEPLQQEI